ncbi:PAS domain S-box protein [Marinibaculum pumilum]|uniref:histidine kinase n=1 Tax=Marinibaculum pumilum TaxID=1766165 RepID=A0ABV7L1F2_9PROT
MRVSLGTKYILFTCGIAVLAAVLLGGFNYYWVRQLSLRHAYASLDNEAQLIAPQIEIAYERMRTDATAIGEMPPFQGIVRASRNGGIDPVDGSTTAEWRDRLQTIFRAILQRRPAYVQMRFIALADGGMELVRVDRSAGRIFAVAAGDLQAKGDRPYVREGMSAAADEVYFSQVTPNYDHGRVQLDLPVIRVVSQMRDEASILYGLIVINADYQALVGNALTAVAVPGDIYVVTGSGDYLKRDKDGRVLPLAVAGAADYRAPAASSGDGELVGEAHFDLEGAIGPGRSATIVLARPESTVLASADSTNSTILALSGGLVVMAALLAMAAARQFSRPMRQAIAAIRGYRPGTTSLSLPVGRHDEIGDLSRAFASLLAELEAAQMAEQKSLARLSTIMDNTVDGLVTVDATGRVRDFNHGAEKLFGYEASEAIGSKIGMLIPDADRREVDRELRQTAGEKSGDAIGVTREISGRHRSGRILSLELAVSEIQVSGERLFSGVMRDISGRKAMEARLAAQAAALRKSNQDLEEFAYIASHDLKEPLRAISNHVQFLAEDCGEAIDEDSRARIDRIRLLCRKAEQLISDLLHFSRLGRAELAVEKIDMEALVAEVRDGLSDLLAERDTEVRLILPLPPARADRTRIVSLLHNLMVNGIKYNDSERPLIEIGFAPGAVGLPGGGKAGSYFVRDNGIGIAEEFRDAVFKIFKRLHNEKAYGPGTGAGLSFARKIVERHGGTLRFESVPGEGTTFYFDLPEAET